jgi:hypothetical protein
MNRVASTISVRHISIPIAKTFSETCSRFESRMGCIDSTAITKMLSDGEAASYGIRFSGMERNEKERRK